MLALLVVRHAAVPAADVNGCGLIFCLFFLFTRQDIPFRVEYLSRKSIACAAAAMDIEPND